MPLPSSFTFNEDYGLGFCLQCMGEYKQSEQTSHFPNWACCYAPSPVGVIGVCFDHIVVNKPSGLARPAGPIPDLLGVDQTQLLNPGLPIPSTASQRRPR